jgi:dihydropteroate synthase
VVTLIMGVLDVTPYASPDGGRWVDVDRAITRGRELIGEGADVVDVAGQPSCPTAPRVTEEQELRRVLPVVEALAPEVRVSIETRTAVVAAAAFEAGASIINDTGGALWETAATLGAGWVALHGPAAAPVGVDGAGEGDVVAEVTADLVARAERAVAHGAGEASA